MTNINKNVSLNQLREFVNNSFERKLEYLPDDFYKEQKKALEIFNKRIFLESVIEETIAFNKSLVFPKESENLKLTRTAEELIEVFKLRSNVYTKIKYQGVVPDTIEGLNFDIFDKNSAIIYNNTNGHISGTARLIFDSKNKLPSDKYYSYDYLRNDFKTIGEISRLIIEKQSNALSLDFKNLMKGIHSVFTNNEIDITVSGIKEEHYKLYARFGGIKREEELKSYGSLDIPFLMISWDPSQASKFFKKAFLKE